MFIISEVDCIPFPLLTHLFLLTSRSSSVSSSCFFSSSSPPPPPSPPSLPSPPLPPPPSPLPFPPPPFPPLPSPPPPPSAAMGLHKSFKTIQEEVQELWYCVPGVSEGELQYAHWWTPCSGN